MSFYSVELPYRTDGVHYFAALADLPWAVWLDSGGMGRYDILTAAPRHTLVPGRETGYGEPFAMLRKALGEPVAHAADVPFAGGALGYWRYDLAQQLNESPRDEQDAVPLPDMAIGIYDWALVLDHRQYTARLVSHQRFAETEGLLKRMVQRLKSRPNIPEHPFRVHGKIASNFTPESYASAFTAVHNYLQAGDCYQINLAQRFSAAASGDALSAYLRLRSLSPAPYSAYLRLPHTQVLCASPERFLRVKEGKVQTRPIKGTRPRNTDVHLDNQLANELRNHPKDRAENLMIVDLLRSDLGKSCLPGSVRVPNLFEVESFANVHHLVSTIEGTLAGGRDALDVLRDCFPGGSVTGAPKLRAMQIINELEPHRRGIYCGAIGYVGFDGNMDTNIAIRTMEYSASDKASGSLRSSGEHTGLPLAGALLAKPADCGNTRLPDAVQLKDPCGMFGGRKGEICCWAGGGIVADSDMAAEFQETMDKAAAMLEILRYYGGES